LGLARLVLVDRALKAQNPFDIKKQFEAGAFLYASPLLTMYLPDGAADSLRSNYAITRYIWSLRLLPGSDQIEAHWFIYQPLFGLAQAMIGAPRTTSAVALAQGLGGSSTHATLKRNTEPIGQVICRLDGTVELHGPIAKEVRVPAFNQILENLNAPLVPMDRTHLANDMPNDSLPPYFVG
jgi:hypothetical protein